MAAISNALFDILESEADYKYYLPNIDDNGFAAEPAFIICTGQFSKMGTKSWTVYMGRGLMDWTVKTEKEAKAQVLQAISKSKRPIAQVKQINRKDKIKILQIERKA